MKLPSSARASLTRLLVIPVIAAAAYLLIPPAAGCACRPEWLAYMKSDLRNLVTAEEDYWADHGRYSDDLTGLRFTPNAGSSVTVEEISPTGWRARAVWVADSSRGGRPACLIWVGDSALSQPGLIEGEPRCLAPQRPRWRFGSYGPLTWGR